MRSGISFRKLSKLEEMLPHFSLIKQLTSSLTYDEYEEMLQQMIPHNYFQLAAYETGNCIAVSGYWIGTKLYSGKYLEIDNFVVDEQYRSAGIGKLMVDRLCEEAKASNCRVVMLDAYVENFKAHHFYYREGFIARGFHYLKFL
jgi:GNAT superfamily N-acetyltransferase